MESEHPAVVIALLLAIISAIAAVGVHFARGETTVRQWLVRVVAFTLCLTVGSQITLVLGRAAACYLRGGCSSEDVQVQFNTLAALTGTLIALLFACLKEPTDKGPDEK